MIKLLDLKPIQDRLVVMVGPYVNYVGRAANYPSALLRESDLPASIWLYPLTTEIEHERKIGGPCQIVERFAILTLHRDINAAPDAGAALQESVRAIRVKALELMAEGDPDGWFGTHYTGGAQMAGGDRLYAWQDQFQTRVVSCQ